MTFDETVRAWVRQVPRGKVVTYGQVATSIGNPRAARAVGFALARTRGQDIPWQRVINRLGALSLGGQPDRPELQRQLLEAEGVVFDAAGRVDLQALQWAGP